MANIGPTLSKYTGAAELSSLLESDKFGIVSVKTYGAVGDGVTDDTIAIQTAIDSLSTNGGIVYFPSGTYMISKNAGTNDKYGIKIINNNITLTGHNSTLRRYSSDITTYSKAYPILFIGTPDSNTANATENIVIDGIKFTGENTRHNSNGSSLHDFRNAIEIKNTKNITIQNCTFENIDSCAINFQSPATYDYTNNQYYNTTKNYNAKILGCSFFASSHSTAIRALLHAINVSGIDSCMVENNYFEWCDDAITGQGTYDNLTDTEDDTYTPSYGGWTLGAVKRTGRNWAFSNNIVYNSSEHAAYFSGTDVVISNNTIRTDEFSICNCDIKVRSRNASVVGNNISVSKAGINISEPSFNVSVTGNTIFTKGETTGAAIEIDSVGLSSYIDNRNWLSTYYQISNISITGNSIFFPTASITGLQNIGIRIFSDNSDANYPEGQIANVTITGNNFKNHKIGIYMLNSLIRNVLIDSNIFEAKTFTSSGFTAGTTLDTYASLMFLKTSANAGIYVKFSNNLIKGSEYVFATSDGTGTTVHLPWGIQNNYMQYVKNFKTSDMRTPAAFNSFTGNTGTYFLDRTNWIGVQTIQNGLGNGSSTDSYLKYNIAYTGGIVVFYTDDSATAITLG